MYPIHVASVRGNTAELNHIVPSLLTILTKTTLGLLMFGISSFNQDILKVFWYPGTDFRTPKQAVEVSPISSFKCLSPNYGTSVQLSVTLRL